MITSHVLLTRLQELKKYLEVAAVFAVDSAGPRHLETLVLVHETLDLMDSLRDEEGHALTLFCDNGDFNGQPDAAIEVCGDWTDWAPKTFAGPNLLACLRSANKARNK